VGVQKGKSMSENYLAIFEEWERLMQSRASEEKTRRKPLQISSAFIVLASAFSGLETDKEYRLFRAMTSLISKENTFKLDEENIEQVAAILLLAAEIKRTQ
jgi:hypothetical protein